MEKMQDIKDLKMYGLITRIEKKVKHKKSGKMISSQVWIFLGSREELPDSPSVMAYHKNNSFLVKVKGEYHVGDIITFKTDGWPWDKMDKRGRIIDGGMFKMSND